jgi:predicted deacylase
MGLHACRAACEAVIAFTPTRVVLDPFCGHGTVLAVANALGLDAIGVELGGKRARKARALTIEALLERRGFDRGDLDRGEVAQDDGQR